MKATPPLLSFLFFAFAGCATSRTPMLSKPATTPLRREAIGGSVTRPPKIVHLVHPVYPLELRQKKVTGYAVIRFIVDKAGKVRDPVVFKATNEAFGRAALIAVSQWTFKPGLRNGRAVNCYMSNAFVFDFNKAPPKVWPDAGP